jgi:ABC-type sugar transport system substrate-binding protein
MNAKRIAIAVAAVCASLSMPAAANENKAMLDLMLKKGVITQKDYNDFMEANKEADENKAFKDFRTDKDVSTSIKDIQKLCG